jgi:hypothetical protein
VYILTTISPELDIPHSHKQRVMLTASVYHWKRAHGLCNHAAPRALHNLVAGRLRCPQLWCDMELYAINLIIQACNYGAK